MNGPTICVLGGSSPFTAGLVDALVPLGDSLVAPTLRLHGRSADNLGLVARYAERQLVRFGWKVTTATDLPDALEGADIVVHQIRYGDLAGRAEGERLCGDLGIPADETLGPAALLTAIKALPDLEQTSRAIVRHCPTAYVLNLTNPLSAVTAAMRRFGVANCVGLCELPLVTQQTVASFFGLRAEEVSWTYSGLNHRGFIDQLSLGTRNLLKELPDALREGTIAGITAEEIRELEVLPLKYFRLIRERPQMELGRADYLLELRRRIQSELADAPDDSPPSLQQRYMEWYPKAVVPMVVALCRRDSSIQIVNIQRDDGLVVETPAHVSSSGIRPSFHTPSNEYVRRWNALFEQHERSFLDAMMEPTYDRLGIVLELDPIVAKDKAASTREELWRRVRRR